MKSARRRVGVGGVDGEEGRGYESHKGESGRSTVMEFHLVRWVVGNGRFGRGAFMGIVWGRGYGGWRLKRRRRRGTKANHQATEPRSRSDEKQSGSALPSIPPEQ